MNTLSRSIAIAGLGLFLAACSREVPVPEEQQVMPAIPVPEVAQAFRQFLDENYAVDMARYPATASYRGIKINHGRWDPVSENFLQESRKIDEARLEQLANFDRAALDSSLQLSYDLYKLDLERRLAADEFRHHQFVIQQYRGPHTEAPGFLINIHQVDEPADAEAYIARLNNISGWFDEVIEQLHIRGEKKLLLADWQYPQIIESACNVISGAPFDDSTEDSTLWADFRKKVAALALPEEQQDELLARARKALLKQVRPAYERLIAALERQAGYASGDDGVWKFERGDEFYAERLRWFTTTDLSAEQIHRLGLREVARIHEEMQFIKRKVGFDGSLQDFFVHLRESPEFYFPNTDRGRADYLAQASELIRVMSQRLPEQFGLLPKATLLVKRVEPFRERSAGKAFYQAPPPDGSRPGIYYANLHDMANMPKYQMEALAYHEGVPGHHLQRAISVELEGLPEFQKYASFTAYTEGWGLYSELLPREMGFYTDPYSDFGRLAMELWRACRLVVDTGIHAKRWTREEAIDYLVRNTPNPVGDATRSIERYVAMPGQATAYLVGKLKIVELRERARAALGERFDIRRFHDLVLEDGPLPLSMLEARVEAMIAE